MHGRVVKEGQQCPYFMASYGKQHETDVALLRSKGLQTILFEDADGVRMISPWEMLAAMAYKPTFVLSGDVFMAWKQAGNGLSAAHAWSALYRTHVMLGGQSTWRSPHDPSMQLSDVLKAGIQLSKHETRRTGGFWVLVECSQEPIAKRANVADVPPTVPFTVDDDGDGSEEEEAVGTKPFVRKPVFVQVNDPRCHAAFNGLGNNGMVILEHVEMNWIIFVNVSRGDVIGSVVQKKGFHMHDLNTFEV